jgi:hypothetical protein
MRILSLGAGVQSSTLALMAEHGEIEKPDYAIFADTGLEPKHCYDWLDWLESNLSYPVLRVQKSSLREDLLSSFNSTGQLFAAVPFFTGNGGMGRRQCTNEYKIQPIIKKCRELLGYAPRKRIPEGAITMMIGISLDEAQRMKPSQSKWIKNEWPLIELRMTRGHCFEWMQKNGFPVPPKSSCTICPYHSDKQWIDLKNSNEWGDIIYLDSVIRVQPKFNNKQYLHKTLKPINEVNFIHDDATVDMFGNECEGMCGV